MSIAGYFYCRGRGREVGLIGFVGIVAPAIASVGHSTCKTIVLSGLVGGLLLIVDGFSLSQVWRKLLPTGAAALIGAPFLLWLLQQTSFNQTSKLAPIQLANIEPLAQLELPSCLFVFY